MLNRRWRKASAGEHVIGLDPENMEIKTRTHAKSALGPAQVGLQKRYKFAPESFNKNVEKTMNIAPQPDWETIVLLPTDRAQLSKEKDKKGRKRKKCARKHVEMKGTLSDVGLPCYCRFFPLTRYIFPCSIDIY